MVTRTERILGQSLPANLRNLSPAEVRRRQSLPRGGGSSGPRVTGGDGGAAERARVAAAAAEAARIRAAEAARKAAEAARIRAAQERVSQRNRSLIALAQRKRTAGLSISAGESFALRKFKAGQELTDANLSALNLGFNRSLGRFRREGGRVGKGGISIDTVLPPGEAERRQSLPRITPVPRITGADLIARAQAARRSTLDRATPTKEFIKKVGRNIRGSEREIQKLSGGERDLSIKAESKLFGLQLKLAGQSFVLGLLNLGLGIAELPAFVKEVRKNPAIIKQLPSSIQKSAVNFAIIAKESPASATGFIAAELVGLKGTGVAIRGVGKIAKIPFGKRVKTTPLGIQEIKKVPKVGDIEIIPPGVRPPRLVNPKKVVKDALLEDLVRTTPKLPQTTELEKEILKIVKGRGDAVTGSFAQETLLKSKFARKHKDIDIVTKNQGELRKAIAKKLGGRVKFKVLNIKDAKTGKRIKVIRVLDSRNNKLIADLDPLSAAEEGFIKRFGFVEHKGLKFVSPKARLASKVTQLGRGLERTTTVGKAASKFKKVAQDIELLLGKKVAVDIPALRGAFGFTKKELRQHIGKTGPLTTAQAEKLIKLNFAALKLFPRDFFGKTPKELLRLVNKKTLELKRFLYVSPFNPKTGKAQLRVSRLNIGEDRPLKLIEWMADDLSFKKTKPTIYVFPEEKLFAKGKLKRRGGTLEGFGRTPKGFVIPEFSAELEAVLGKGWAIKKGKQLARVNLDGKLVPIVELKKVRLSTGIKSLVRNKAKLIKSFRKGKTKNVVQHNKITLRKINSLDNKLRKKLERETGFDFKDVHTSARPKKVKFVSPKRIVAKTVLRSRFKPVSPKRPPSSPPSRPPRRPPSSPPSRPPAPSGGPSQPPQPSSRPTSPRRPPSRPPRRPPSRPPRAPPRITRPLIGITKKKRKGKVRVGQTQVYNVFGKDKGRFIKLNRIPLRKTDALNRGSFAIDNTTSRTLRIVPVGTTKKPGIIKAKEKRHFQKNKNKLRDFRIIKGKRKTLRNTYIERTRHAIDSRGEKTQLSLARFIKKENLLGKKKRRKR